MSAIGSREVGLAVLKAAGMSTDRCLGFSVEFEPDAIVVIHARYAADAQTIEAVVKAVTPRIATEQNGPGDAPQEGMREGQTPGSRPA
jgi:hypothetical protein